MKNYEQNPRNSGYENSGYAKFMGGLAVAVIVSLGVGHALAGNDKLCSEETTPVTVASYYENSDANTDTIDGMVRTLSVGPNTSEDKVQQAIDEVVELNGLDHPSSIREGQEIDVPVDCGRD